jgi:hypothetical protein
MSTIEHSSPRDQWIHWRDWRGCPGAFFVKDGRIVVVIRDGRIIVRTGRLKPVEAIIVYLAGDDTPDSPYPYQRAA